MTEKKQKKLRLRPIQLLANALAYVVANPLFCLCLFVANMAYMLLFRAIHGGISNPLSLVWLVGYYIFWCVFYRYYYGLRPYFFFKAVTDSLKPSTKALGILFLVMLIIVFMPMMPLFLGYDELYLEFYEGYMKMFEGLSKKSDIGVPWEDILMIYGIFALAAPALICKPYMSWIASLCRRSLSFTEAGNKLRGNYLPLVLISFILTTPEALAGELDRFWHLQNWFSYSISALLFVYTNIVFAKIYDFFYVKN